MFAEYNKSGKHLIADIKEIKNVELLNDIGKMNELLDVICKKYSYTVLSKNEHQFTPFGLTILYLLSESHLSIHTFPERNYFAFDLYTCRESETDDTYLEIYNFLLKEFNAKGEYTIIDRGW
jgi:S-adenosylmethionine decarboxylase